MSTNPVQLLKTYRNVAIIGFCEFTRTSVLALYFPFWTLYLLELGASIIDIGVLSLVSGVIGIIFQLPVAYLGDLYGRKKIVAVCEYSLSVGLLISSLAQTWVWVIPGVIFMTFGYNVVQLAIASITDGIPKDKIGKALSFRLFMISVPRLFVPAFSGYLSDRIGVLAAVRLVLLFASIIMAITATVWLLLVKEQNGRSKPVKMTFSQSLKEMTQPIVKYRDLQILAFDGIAHSLQMGFVGNFVPIFIVKVIGLSKTDYGLIQSISYAAGLISWFPMSSLIQRFGDRRSLILSAAFRPVLLPLFTFSRVVYEFALSHSLYLVMEHNIEATARQAYITNMVESKEKGTALAASSVLVSPFHQFSTSINAVIWESFGPYNAFYINSLLYFFLAVPLVLKLKQKKPLSSVTGDRF